MNVDNFTNAVQNAFLHGAEASSQAIATAGHHVFRVTAMVVVSIALAALLLLGFPYFLYRGYQTYQQNMAHRRELDDAIFIVGRGIQSLRGRLEEIRLFANEYHQAHRDRNTLERWNQFLTNYGVFLGPTSKDWDPNDACGQLAILQIERLRYQAELQELPNASC